MSDYDDEMEHVYREVTFGDPGHLGDDEPALQPLCRQCVRDLPIADSGLCEFCRVAAR